MRTALWAALALGLCVLLLIQTRSTRPYKDSSDSRLQPSSSEQEAAMVELAVPVPKRGEADGAVAREVQAGDSDVHAGGIPGQLLVSDHLTSLKAAILVLPDYDGTDAGIRRKYEGLEPKDLLNILPILHEIRREEMFKALDDAIESGQYASELLGPGEFVDYEKYKTPGSPDEVHFAGRKSASVRPRFARTSR